MTKSVQVNSAKGISKAKKQQHVLQLMSLPVFSVDFNSIELIWDKLEQKDSLTNHMNGSPLATLAGKLGRTIFSLLPVFGGKNVENL